MSENPKDVAPLVDAEAAVCESLCEKSTDSAAPTAADGPLSPRPAAPASEPPEAPPGAEKANVGPPAAPPPALAATAASNVFEAAAVQALTGEPHAWTVTQFCKKCQADVLPVGKGECPRCHCALRLNFRARRHPVNVTRRDQLYAEIVAEYRPHSLELRDACRYLANVKERLETTKDGAPEHQRLMAMWSDLSAQLRTANRETSTTENFDNLTEDQLIESTEKLLERMRESRDFKRQSAEPVRNVVTAAVDDGYMREPGNAEQEAHATTVTQPAPAESGTCKWCNRSPCIGREHPAFDVLHALDPEEVERRHRAANEDDYDQRIALAQGWPTSRMIEKARGPKMTDEERRQAELRRKFGWESGGTRRV